MSDPGQARSSPLDGRSTRPGVNVSVRENQDLTMHRILGPVLEALDVSVLLIDRTWRVTYLSYQSDPVLAQTREALLGKTLWEVFPEVVDSPFFHRYHDALRTSLAVHREEYYPPSRKWFELHLLPSPEGWAVSVQDVTSRKQAEEALASMAAIVASSDDAIFSKTLDGTILSWNRGAERLYGYAAREIIGQPVQTLVPADRHQELQELMHLLQAGERIDHFETVRVRKDRSLVGVSVTISPVKDATGQIIGASAIARDITEHAIAEQRKDDFISMASHELKTPLTSLLGYTELLRQLLVGKDHQKAMHYLSRMDAQLTRLSRLIADLLDMARVQASKLVFAEEPVGIDDLVRETVEHFQPTAPQHRILITGEATCEVVGDRDRLGQVIFNLLSNAVKYSPGAETVIVSMAETPDEVTISVQDFGIGIAPHYQERIFERFYRISSTREKLFPGLGIGLYLCHEIIGHYGGRIWVKSVEGHGSTFSFALPRKSI